MMRSLWSGVSGLRVHQFGMDVEGNNIANVNTYGFKYSRVNYSTMFSQTMSIATQPTNNLGGRNAKQVGLGVEATATQRIHSQGNMQTTDSNYDVAISGNGFFLVSNDGGKTQYLTRDGAFNQDAAGNFVNSSGYVVQGWVRDPVTGRIDTSLPASNLSWDPSMSIPANPSSEIYLNASLNSGSKITQETSRYIYSLDSLHGGRITTGETYANGATENSSLNNQFYTTSSNALDLTEKGIDFGAVFSSATYESLNLRNGQSFWFSYGTAKFETEQVANLFVPTTNTRQNGVTFWGDSVQATILDVTLNGVHIYGDNIRSIDAAMELFARYKEQTGVTVGKSTDGRGLIFTNENANGTDGDEGKNVRLVVGSSNTAGELWDIGNAAGTTDGRVEADYELTQVNGVGGIKDQPNNTNTTWIATQNSNSKEVITAHRYQYSSSAVDIPEMADPVNGTFNPANIDADGADKNYAAALLGDLLDNDARIFHTTEDLRELMQRDARYGVDYNGLGTAESRGSWANMSQNINHNATVTVNSTGRYQISNPAGDRTIPNITFTAGNTYGDITLPQGGANIVISAANNNNTTTAQGMKFQATSYKSEAAQISTNDALTTLFKGLQGTLDAGNQTRQSVSMVLSSYSSALQVYDSLGTKHLIRVEWTKHETTLDGGNLWQMILRIDEPATFNGTGIARNNIIVGEVRFGNDGSLVSYDPADISFSGNNGSAPNQRISLNLGAAGGFNGLVSNDQTSGISQQDTDGYPPGMMLQGMQNKQIDEEGNIIAAFSNGIQMYIAKIAMGNVTNEAGLEEMGSNLFRTSANSGTLTIGTSNTGGRGSFKSATLEMSNADLSLALTNLIVIQRGYQANSKTITTSDTMLNTLLQLKQ